MVQNQIFRNIFILLIFSFLFVACANKNSIYNMDNKMLSLGKDADSIVSISFTNAQIQRYSGNCVLDSYTLTDKNTEYGNLFIESITLDNSCDWRGLPSSFFETNLKYELKLNRIETVENFDIDSYNFKTFRINGDSYLSMIYIYSGGSERFILDYYGRLYNKLLKNFKPEYVNKYFAKKRFLGNYNDSLVRKSFINRYFERERIEVIPRIGISISL